VRSLRAARVLLRCLAAGLLAGGACVVAQDAPQTTEPPARASLLDFETDALLSTWTASDGSATITLTNDKQNVAAGNGALQFAYAARPGVFQQVSTNGFGASSGNTLSLKLKASSPTSVSLGIQEQNGAQYQGLLWIGANEWVSVRTPLSDLILAQGAVDDNGRPDGDQVTGFFLADLANLQGEVGQALGYKAGDQRIWLDDLALVDDPHAKSRGSVEKLGDEWALILDGFEDDVCWGLPIRRAGLKLVPGAPQAKGQRGLEITYTLGAGRWVGYVLAPPGRFDLSTATKFHMWAKTDLNARLVIVLEERDGAKYDTAAKVPPDGKWHSTLIPFEDFAPADAGADANGQLDADQISRVIVLVDTFDADVRPGGLGSIVVDDVALVTPTAPEGDNAR